MNIKPILHKITIYPVKSLDGMDLNKATISEGGCLLHDREFAISDEEGHSIIGKSNPLVYTLRSSVNFEDKIISLRHQNENVWNHFHFQKEILKIQTYLTGYFGIPIILHQNTKGRFMDIPDISGVTVISTSSLQSISEWFPGMNLDEARKRFRATLEIEAVPAFWEDHLFCAEERGIEFKVGEVTLFGMTPRARCVVPTRNPETGIVLSAFPKTFARHRASSLPEWSALKKFGHHYHLTVNCYIPASEIGKCIEIGDEVIVIGKKDFY